MYSYIHRHFGFKCKRGVSVFTLCCQALEKDGRLKPSEVSAKAWAYKNAVYIKGEPVRALAEKLKTPKEYRTPSAVSPEFLSSYEWRALRMNALTKYGARCQCCGASPQTGAVMNVDHIKPRRLFPNLALDLDNLQVLCHECNHGKGNWDQTDWRQEESDPDVLAMLRDIAKNG